MTTHTTHADATPGSHRWGWVLAATLAVVAVGVGIGLTVTSGQPEPFWVGLAVGQAVLLIWALIRSRQRRGAVRRLAVEVAGLANDSDRPFNPPADGDLRDLVGAVHVLRHKLGEPLDNSSFDGSRSADWSRPRRPAEAMTRSGMYELPSNFELPFDPLASADFGAADMICRLDPRDLHWLDASAAAQQFLGWDLDDLRTLGFPEIVHPDHRDLAREQLLGSAHKGEAHGLIYRIRTARGEPKAVEINVGVRYGPDSAVSHLRCHLTDVTDKLRAGRELRRRTKELTHANEQLRRVNRELQELKDRYSDLYQNAPAMYFSLDPQATIRDCNNTLLRTLGFRRKDLIGQPYTTILSPERHATFRLHLDEFFRSGFVEVESRWLKADGTAIDVWITGSAVRAADGTITHSRSIAQDVTARRALEAELREKNRSLARANEELSRKNKELDEFTYVVSHDLQEPLRTLIAFSDFLLKDYGDRFDQGGREYVNHLVDASRRMRSLIHGLLSLSRAGRVTADFAPVDLGALLDVVTADLAELIRSRAADIRVEGPLPTIWGDRDRLGQLFVNLIGNGLKYNQAEAPEVVIGADRPTPEGLATLYVRDNGIGIDPQFHTKVFQLFRRLHARDQYEGTGAGLAICQKIVQAHGGRIWVESERGRGATFFVSLPMRRAEAPRPRPEILNVP